MSSDNPLISIITPHYNGTKHHTRFYKMLLDQSYRNWELILIDDYSEEDSFLKLQSKFSKNSQTKIIRNSSNKGPAFSRNLAIKKSKGAYIAFADIDDYWSSEKLSSQIKEMLIGKYNFSCTAFYISDGDRLLASINNHNINLKNLVRFRINIACSSVMIKNNMFQLEFNEQLRHAEDYFLWARLFLDPKIKINYLNNPNFLIYHKSQNSLSSNKLKQLKGVLNANSMLFTRFQAIYYTLSYIFFSLRRKIKISKLVI